MSASLGLFFFNEMKNDLADRCIIVQVVVLLGGSNKKQHYILMYLH